MLHPKDKDTLKAFKAAGETEDIERIEQFGFEHKDTRISVQIGKALEKAAKAVPDAEHKVRLAASAGVFHSINVPPWPC